MKIGDRVIWTGAKPGGWAGNGKGVIADYEAARRHFVGGPSKNGEATTGPAVGILLDQGDPENCIKKFDVWVAPSAREIVEDADFVAPVAAA